MLTFIWFLASKFRHRSPLYSLGLLNSHQFFLLVLCFFL